MKKEVIVAIIGGVFLLIATSMTIYLGSDTPTATVHDGDAVVIDTVGNLTIY